jgi:type VI secretion system protein ImpH
MNHVPSRPTVEQQLLEESPRFDFFQAVRLLEMLSPEAISIGESPEWYKESIHFSSNVSLAFPPEAIQEIVYFEKERQPLMVVNFMGLAGVLGPMPIPYTEILLERLRKGDTAWRNFLDMFNHRLISLAYRARTMFDISNDVVTTSPNRVYYNPLKRKKGNPPTSKPTYFRAEDVRLAQNVFSLAGLASPHIRSLHHTDNSSYLQYGSLFSQQIRSVQGLVHLVSSHFGLKVRVEEFQGEWLPIDQDQRTVIGRGGMNTRLSSEAVAGKKIWNQHSAFTVEFYQMGWDECIDFLTNNSPALKELCELVWLYLKPDARFSLRFTIPSTALRQTVLSYEPTLKKQSSPNQKVAPACLGRTAMLCSYPEKRSEKPISITLSPSVTSRKNMRFG